MKSNSYLPLTISLETLGGISTPLILKGTPLPAKRTNTFSTATDDQKAVSIKVYLGESKLAAKNYLLATCDLTELPIMKKGVPQISVTFEVDCSLKLKVIACEKTSGKIISVETEDNTSKITDSKIAEMLEKAKNEACEDEEEVKRIESRAKKHQLIEQAEKYLRNRQERGNMNEYDKELEIQLASIGPLISEEDNTELAKQIEKLETALKEAEEHDVSNIFSFLNNSASIDSVFKNWPVQSLYRDQSRVNNGNRNIKNTNKEQERGTDKARSLSEEDYRREQLSKKQTGKLFGDSVYTVDPNLCFVLMPFSENLKPIFTDHIKPVVSMKGMKCVRADEIVGTQQITIDIWESINRARIVIADMTGQNPNVFYEIGLSHSLGKDVILLSQNIKDVSFDLKSLRCIIYDFTPRGMKDMEDKLGSTIDYLLKK